jgi:hypothetical protein
MNKTVRSGLAVVAGNVVISTLGGIATYVLLFLVGNTASSSPSGGAPRSGEMVFSILNAVALGLAGGLGGWVCAHIAQRAYLLHGGIVALLALFSGFTMGMIGAVTMGESGESVALMATFVTTLLTAGGVLAGAFAYQTYQQQTQQQTMPREQSSE